MTSIPAPARSALPLLPIETQRASGFKTKVWLAAIALAVMSAALLISGTKATLPFADSVEYLVAAHNLKTHGTHSLARGDEPPTPSDYREPGYAAFLALLMIADPDFSGFSPACLDGDAPCGTEVYTTPLAANGVFIALSGLAIFATVWLATGRPAISLLAGALIWFNFELADSRHWLVSDYLALFCLSAALWTLTVGIVRRKLWTWPAAGLLLAGLVLTKAVFLYGIVPVLVLCLIGAGLRRHRRWLAPVLLVSIGFALPTAAWIVRNGEALDTWAVTEGRSGPVLLTRERLNDMTAREYLIAFVYWTRGFGDSLAEDIFGPDSYRRLSVDTPDGFYGEALADYPRRVEAYAAEHGTTPAQARRAVDAEIKNDIVTDLPRHLAVTLPVFYRGLWVDEFIVWTLPSLLWIGWLSLRRRAYLALLWLYPAAFSLLFHALFTLNLPRFHIPATASLAIAGALAVGEIVDRRRRKPQRPR